MTSELLIVLGLQTGFVELLIPVEISQEAGERWQFARKNWKGQGVAIMTRGANPRGQFVIA
jgi:hypothetical protein